MQYTSLGPPACKSAAWRSATMNFGELTGDTASFEQLTASLRAWRYPSRWKRTRSGQVLAVRRPKPTPGKPQAAPVRNGREPPTMSR
jgi:hypothetical protein